MQKREIMIIALFIFVLVMVYVIDVLKGTERASHFAEANSTQEKVESVSREENNQSRP